MTKRKRAPDRKQETFVAAVEAGIAAADRGRLVAHDDVAAAVLRRQTELTTQRS